MKRILFGGIAVIAAAASLAVPGAAQAQDLDVHITRPLPTLPCSDVFGCVNWGIEYGQAWVNFARDASEDAVTTACILLYGHPCTILP